MNSTIMKKKYLKNYSGSNVSVEWGVDGQGDRLGEPAVVKMRVIEAWTDRKDGWIITRACFV